MYQYECAEHVGVKPGRHMRTKRFANLPNQICVCVDATVNMRCPICKLFAYHSLRTKICHFFMRMQRELGVPGVLCSPHICGKLIYHTPSANCSVRMWFAYAYLPLYFNEMWDIQFLQTGFYVVHILLCGEVPTTISQLPLLHHRNCLVHQHSTIRETFFM